MSGYGDLGGGYPTDRRARYRKAGLWEDRTIPQQFRAVAKSSYGVAVRTGDGSLSYPELDRRSDAVAAGLIAAGLAPGDAVIVQLTNSIRAVVAWYGMLKAGVIPVCTLAVHRRHEIEQIASQTEAVGHLVQADFRGFDMVAFAKEIQSLVPTLRLIFAVAGHPDADTVRVEDLEHREVDAADRRLLVEADEAIGPDGVAVYQLSGGTTAVPKVIPRRHAEYWYNAVATARWWNHGPESVLAFGLPLQHNAGVSNALHAAHAVGAELLLGTPPADVLMPLMARHDATFFMSPPGLLREYLDHPDFDAAFANVRNCVLTAAPVPRSLFDELQSRGVQVKQAFGMSEGLFVFTPPDASDAVRATTVGMPISPLDEVKVLAVDSEEPVPPGEVGELCARGPYTITGYLNAPERNAEAFTADGYYRSGDLVRLRTIDGLEVMSIEGRVKDLIDRGGEKINAEEVERLLMQHPAVREVALVAMPDPRLGERACAYVVPATSGSSPTLGELCEFLRGRGLTKFKWPERLEFIDVLPRTQIGKVSKALLREDIRRRLKSGPGVAPSESNG
jgi:2,3-dihydroxybenzoate-AMP ligase